MLVDDVRRESNPGRPAVFDDDDDDDDDSSDTFRSDMGLNRRDPNAPPVQYG